MSQLCRQWYFLPLLVCVLMVPAAFAQSQDKDKANSKEQPANLAAHWDKFTSVSKTTATLQVVVNPPLRRGTPIHDNAFKSLHDVQADYVRYVPWLPYPRLGIAELEPPANGKTSWDFSLIDPMTIDFLEATKGHSVILNFSTIPAWMFIRSMSSPHRRASPSSRWWTAKGKLCSFPARTTESTSSASVNWRCGRGTFAWLRHVSR